MRVILFASLIWLTACQHAPVRCDHHLVPINLVTKTPAASVSKPSAEHP
ncbi:MAG: hypothetical protein ACREUT_04630 [Steroidobacteraceae bacterium]